MYDAIARYYDLAHDGLDDDIPALLELARTAGGPALELGCGSGRLLVPLAHAGVTVTGVDSSAAMLDRARERLAAEPAEARERVTLVEADFKTLPTPGEPFALAFFGYNTFMHLSESEAIAALKRVRAASRVGGLLWLDLENPFAIGGDPDDALTLEASFDDEGRTVHQYSAYRDVPGEQAIDVTWVYEETPEGDMAVRSETRFRQHYYYPHQIDLIFSQAGFRLVALSGGYAGEPYSEDSDRLLATGTAV